MNFQPLGTAGDELSDCKRYFIARMWRPRDHWEVWLQASDGPNTRLAKHLTSKEAARAFCETHAQELKSAKPPTKAQERRSRTPRSVVAGEGENSRENVPGRLTAMEADTS